LNLLNRRTTPPTPKDEKEKNRRKKKKDWKQSVRRTYSDNPSNVRPRSEGVSATGLPLYQQEKGQGRTVLVKRREERMTRREAVGLSGHEQLIGYHTSGLATIGDSQKCRFKGCGILLEWVEENNFELVEHPQLTLGLVCCGSSPKVQNGWAGPSSCL
jgi:hypothetical protein